MNDTLIKATAASLNLSPKAVSAVLTLLAEGATVPFIARYRKEMTGSLTEDQIRDVSQAYEYSVKLAERKEDVIRLIEERGMMNDALKRDIMACEKLSDVEDLYRPYKEKKKTRAAAAIALGLQPLADEILKFPRQGSLEELAKPFVNDNVTSVEDALQGAKDIIAETVSDDARNRQYTKNGIMSHGRLVTKKKKNAVDEKGVYEMYYDYSAPIKTMPTHRVLAINRGEKEKILTVTFDVNKDHYHRWIYRRMTRKFRDWSFVEEFVQEAVADGFDRLLVPSVEREVRATLTSDAEEQSLGVFSTNLEHLLLQAPLKGRYVLGLDPGFRTGCKLAAVDPTGKLLGVDKCYISMPKKDHSRDEKTLLSMISTYKCEIIAMGNGTASRESEAFIANFIRKYHLDVQYVIVSEAGASVYSASPLAKEEFPDLQVEERSAVSIARRLQDPLAELVKIDPKSISVGQYQHDMNQKKLGEQLDFVVEKVVNRVGVNINTASPSLLKHVSGLTNVTAKNIVAKREKDGVFTSRKQILDVPKIGPKAFEQCAGFLRVPGAANVLDDTAVHPESYKDAMALLDYLKMTPQDIGTRQMKARLQGFDKQKAMNELGISLILLNDLLDAFTAPHREPRDNAAQPVLRSDVLKLEDLHVGMKLEGTVRNVVDFGAFVDIGLHDDGLVHVSKMGNHRVSHPTDVVNVGDIINVTVIDVDLKRHRVGLSLVD